MEGLLHSGTLIHGWRLMAGVTSVGYQTAVWIHDAEPGNAMIRGPNKKSRSSKAAPAGCTRMGESGRLRRRGHDVEDDVEYGPFTLLVVILIVAVAVALRGV